MAIVTAQRTLCLLIILAVVLLIGISTTASTTPSVARAVAIALHDVDRLRAEVEDLQLKTEQGAVPSTARLIRPGAQAADDWQAIATLARSSREGVSRLAQLFDRAGDFAGTRTAVDLLTQIGVVEQRLQARNTAPPATLVSELRKIRRDLLLLNRRLQALDPTRKRRLALASNS